eukprot:scaffold2429_cov149-Skeletonema_menzelii.AAC.1
MSWSGRAHFHQSSTRPSHRLQFHCTPNFNVGSPDQSAHSGSSWRACPRCGFMMNVQPLRNSPMAHAQLLLPPPAAIGLTSNKRSSIMISPIST